MKDEDNFNITLDAGRPIEVRFDEGKISFKVSASRFVNNGTAYRTPFFIRQEFDLVRSEDGKMKLVGDGPPKVDFQTGGQKSAGEVSFRRLLQDRMSTRWQKSSSDSNGPPDCFAARMDSIAPRPTFRTAPSPKRMWVSPVTVNFHPDSLTEGGSTSRPNSRASLMYVTTLSVSPISEESNAAMNSAA